MGNACDCKKMKLKILEFCLCKACLRGVRDQFSWAMCQSDANNMRPSTPTICVISIFLKKLLVL